LDVRKGKQLLKLHETDAERPKGRAALGDRKIEQPLTIEKVEEHWQSKRCLQVIERWQVSSRRAVSKRTGRKNLTVGHRGPLYPRDNSKSRLEGTGDRPNQSQEIIERDLLLLLRATEVEHHQRPQGSRG